MCQFLFYLKLIKANILIYILVLPCHVAIVKVNCLKSLYGSWKKWGLHKWNLHLYRSVPVALKLLSVLMIQVWNCSGLMRAFQCPATFRIEDNEYTTLENQQMLEYLCNLSSATQLKYLLNVGRTETPCWQIKWRQMAEYNMTLYVQLRTEE